MTDEQYNAICYAIKRLEAIEKEERKRGVFDVLTISTVGVLKLMKEEYENKEVD